MGRRALRGLVSAIACAPLLACHQAPAQTADTDMASDPAGPTQPAIEDPEVVPHLERGAPHRAPLAEVVLDARGEAALTLDEEGGVRLWPRLSESEFTPWTLPFQEPTWMSLARSEIGFTVGVLDTTNAGHVMRVRVDEKGQATLEEAFTVPPTDPLLELHVLDGGARVLALGIDHRLRLYDLGGKLLSQIDEPGFAPWQLRLTGGDGEEPLHLAVTLAHPLRIQGIEIEGDTLSRVGAPRELVLDRGPNRNDLVLSADGRFAAAMRRRSGLGKDWTVELIDLASGERKLIGGRTGTSFRPRLHLLPDDRLLLESADGRGHLVDLERALPVRQRAHAEPDSSMARRLSSTMKHDLIDLPGSAEEKGATVFHETGLRFHASVAGDTRAALLPGHRAFVVHRPDVDGKPGLDFPAAGEVILGAGVDASGHRLAWVTSNRVHVERLDATGGKREVIDIPLDATNHRRNQVVVFTDRDHLVVADRYADEVELFDLVTGARTVEPHRPDEHFETTDDLVDLAASEEAPVLPRVRWDVMRKDQPQTVEVRPEGSGAKPWSLRVPSVRSMSVAGGRFVLNTGLEVIVVELATGKELTRRIDAEPRVEGAAAAPLARDDGE